jgi:hypothetical protein
MPFWIEGWVEVARVEDKADEYAWQGLMRINPLVDTADEMSECLFGLSKRVVAGEFEVAVSFGSRGIPPNPSSSLQEEIATIEAHERRFGEGEMGGYTHATWRELKSLDSISAGSRVDSEWSLMFNLLRCLEQSGRYDDDGIRLVVWYNW